MATIDITSSLAEETRDFLTVSANRVYSNGKSGENEYSDSMPKSINRIYISARLICYRSR